MDIINSQLKSSWCGPASVSAALKRLGYPEKITGQRFLVKELKCTDEEGTSQLNMYEGLRKLGVDCFISQTDLKTINQFVKDKNYQVIVNWMAGRDPKEDGHYSILREIGDNYVSLDDPDFLGRITIIKKNLFIRQWWDYEGKKISRCWSLILKRK